MARGPAALVAAAWLAGCAAPPEVARAPGALPPMMGFEGPPAGATAPNAELAQDFMDVTFRMESGARLPVLTRYEGPIRVGVAGPAAPTLERDLEALLRRLREEAGLDVARARGEANVVIETVPLATMRRLVPQAACFVVPNAASWEEYRRLRRTDLADWTRVGVRERTVIFVPDMIPPQELRDCLHEELAQALGPLGDRWRLAASVFNDDNFHAVLTPSDMALLRATYDPALRSGMGEAEVAAALPSVLSRANPRGGRARPVGARTASRAFAEAIDEALREDRDEPLRRAAARRAAALAQAPVERAFALYALGRLSLASDEPAAAAAFDAAAAIYAADPRTEIHAAHVGLQQAALALRHGEPREALGIARRHRAAAGRGQNAALLATLGLVEAEALLRLGRAREARRTQIDSLGWARYGFGSEEAVRERLAEIASLPPAAAGEPGS